MAILLTVFVGLPMPYLIVKGAVPFCQTKLILAVAALQLLVVVGVLIIILGFTVTVISPHIPSGQPPPSPRT